MTMSAAIELVDDAREFFAPISSDVVDGLIGKYDAMRRRIEALAEAVDAEQYNGALYYFPLSGSFGVSDAVAKLNAEYWTQALNLTDVLSTMPQKRRDEWFEQIRNPLGRKKNKHTGESELPPLPGFTEETVRATLGDLLASRSKFFAERVDGIFRALSRNHVTNCPQGFSKRMILARVLTEYGTIDYQQSGHIGDLRCVIAKFMGRDEPHYSSTDAVIRAARRRPGEWMSVDGGAFRIRVYAGVGTAHLEVHPEMSWRLNAVLASLHPAAIPANFRTKPKRKLKEFALFGRPLPFAVLANLTGLRQASERVKSSWPERYINIPNSVQWLGNRDGDKTARKEAEKVLEAIGGVYDQRGWFQFDYDPTDIIDEIVCSGCIPDQKSHQFYPTKSETVGAAAIEMADIGELDECCEPNAGQGHLAALMPKDRTTCVEISELHCAILRARGFNTVQADFLEWAKTAPKFDRIVMNPPYSEQRWRAHLEAAFGLLKDEGRLVAILPSSTKDKELIAGARHRFSTIFENQFAGTSVSVVIVCIDRISNG